MLWDYRLERKWSVVGFCSGAVAGLVAITPASGYVGAPAAVLFGFMAGTICNFATQLKFLLNYDDTLDVSIFSLFYGLELDQRGILVSLSLNSNFARSIDQRRLDLSVGRKRLISYILKPLSLSLKLETDAHFPLDLRLARHWWCRRQPPHRPLRPSLYRRS